MHQCTGRKRSGQDFCQALESANGRSIIVHMDIGGDSPVDHLNIPGEANPFLGYRAVRIQMKNTPRLLHHTTTVYSCALPLTAAQNHDHPMISPMEEILLGEKKNWRKPNRRVMIYSV
ncbi:putative PEP-binding protein [Shigella flexneri]